ncbi:MAG: DUF3160 domain-containing protein [Deferribacterota bacterium]|nr:DUF3160 domain-containing protein [Deferribacterota bacterium]
MMFKKFLLYFTIVSIILLCHLNIYCQENTQNDGLGFENYYAYNPINIQAKVPPYKLPLDIKSIANFDDFIRKIPLKEGAVNLLAKNGFVVIENPFFKSEEDITAPYKIIKDNNIPLFITTDSLLHLYHIQFDETLRQIEEKEFYDYIWEISNTLFNKSVNAFNSASGDLKEALKRNVAYFSTALMLLKPKNDQLCRDEKECNDPGLKSAYFSQEDLEKYNFNIPEFVKDIVEAELKLIEAHKGFDNSPIFIYREDYSQYVPRGHYTRSEKLKNYFKAFTWFGRMSMLLKGTDQVDKGQPCNEVPPCKALISLYDAKIQTMQASLIASFFNEDKQLFSKWERIYKVTAFYVGFSDDLGPYEYIEALDYVFNSGFTPDKLTDENIEKIKSKLAEYSSPKIYGGTGELALNPPFSPEQVDELLTITKGFRLMGQRFVPDSYMFTELVSPSVGMYIGNRCSQTFTCKLTDGGEARVFPRGLDIMALLGSKKALELLRIYGDTEYMGHDSKGNIINYDTQFNKLREEFNSFNIFQWQKNLYWSWLYSLKALLEEFENGYPTFMNTDALHTG